MSRRYKPAPDPEKDALERKGAYIVAGELLLTEYEWSTGATPTDKQLEQRRREVLHFREAPGFGAACGAALAPHTDQPAKVSCDDCSDIMRLELRAQAPIRARVDQADMADTPLFGQGQLL